MKSNLQNRRKLNISLESIESNIDIAEAGGHEGTLKSQSTEEEKRIKPIITYSIAAKIEGRKKKSELFACEVASCIYYGVCFSCIRSELCRGRAE